MYSFPYYKENDFEIVKQFMRTNPFVLLTGVNANHEPVATQVPVLLEERDSQLFLIGHVQRKTDHQLAFEQNPNALAIFTGPHTYVSASWYTNPQTASTWNYMSVHVKGKLTFLGESELLNILSRTTAHFENDTHSPALLEKMPEEYVSKMMKAIVAFEIAVTDIGHVFKLSQNRDKESFNNIIPKLKEQGGEAAEIAAEMEKRSSQLFKE
jgi:transcriptional regulator